MSILYKLPFFAMSKRLAEMQFASPKAERKSSTHLSCVDGITFIIVGNRFGCLSSNPG